MSADHHHHPNAIPNIPAPANNVAAARTATAATAPPILQQLLLLRPTEAQLRWAQFHRESTAAAVRQRVERLYQQPHTANEKEAEEENGWSSSSSSSSTNVPTATTDAGQSTRRRRRPRISRGRRCMLRASQRRCEARRQTVAEQGYCWWCGDDDDDNDNEHTPGHPDDDDDGDDDEDFLDAIFSNRSSSSKPKLQRRKTMSRRRLRHPRSRSSSKQFLLEDDDDDDERIRRFEAAFTAMMASLSHGKYQGGTNNKIVATKIWTRPEQLDGELLSMEYSDWKIYGSNVKKPRDNTTGGIHNNNGSLDRSASWLVHLPTKEKKFSTAMRQHLTEVARRYLAAEQQQKLGRANGSNGTEDEEKYNWNENDDDDALTLVDHFERHAMDENNSNNNNINTFHDRDGEDNGISFGRRTILDRIARYNDDDNGHDAIRTKGVVQVLSPNTADLIRQFEEPSQSHNNNDEDEAQKVGSFVQRLVSHMEAATTRDREVLVSADGKLHKPAFARLIQHYLLSQSTATITRSNRRISSRDASLYSKPLTQSTTLPAMDQNNTPVFEANQEYSSGPNFCGREQDATLDDEIEDDETDSAGQTIPTFVRNFIEQIELDDEVNTVISADGTLDRPIFESLVQKYLAAATRKCLQNDVAETSPNPRQTSKEHDEMMRGRLQSGSDKPEDVDDSDPSQTSFLGHIHNAGHLLKSLTIGRSDSSSGSSKQPEPNSLGKGEITGDKKIATQDSLHAGKKLVGSVSNKVTELFHSLNSRSTTDEAAYSAFRSAQDKRRSGADDTASSQSSFSILPSGIRSVIKGYRDGKLPSAQYSGDDSDSEHKRETDNEDSADQFDDDDDDGVSENLSSPIGPESSNDLSSSHATRLAPALKEPNPNETVFYADGSLVSGDGEPGHTVGSLMLSPTLLTKRHKQVIRAVENRKWDQVRYLLSANPWLAEMADVNTNQYVLHKLSFYGSGLLGMDPFTGEVISLRFPSSPIQINMDLVRLFPSSVHKFDSDGNLPLHLAAASANVTMIKLLGEIFPGGASVRNEDGMLPLHLAIIACASPIAATFETDVAPNDIVQMITKYFPGALAVEDNEDESERQMSGPGGVRFRNKISLEAMDDKTIDTGTAVMSLDSCSRIDDVVNLMEIQNEVGNTPLSLAIQSRAGWEVIDALTCKSNDTQLLDSDGNNALHLLVCDRYKDPSAALAILRRIPELAKNRNENGMLPIEIACMQMLPREVILAIVLVDLPIDLDQKGRSSYNDGCGASWAYLSCECDDFYSDIVNEVISLCSFAQIRSLCLFCEGKKEMVLARSTPKCKNALLRALRVIGRYEFVESAPVYSDAKIGVTAFNALDFGNPNNPLPEGRRVLMKCFTNEEHYRRNTVILAKLGTNVSHFEDVFCFIIGKDDRGRGPLPDDGRCLFCISTERPELTLSSVVRGMIGNKECQNHAQTRRRYANKVFSVLRQVAKALQRLHKQGLVHGNLCLESFGKYDESWKLADVLGAQTIEDVFEVTRLSSAAPPESVLPSQHRENNHSRFRSDLVALPSIDSWGFGKLAYEVLVGDVLIEFDVTNRIHSDDVGLDFLSRWSEKNLQDVRLQLKHAGLSGTEISLITHCLRPEAKDRLDLDGILLHSAWTELRQQK